MAEIDRARLGDLLVDPREDLGLEIKNWLDLRNSNDDKATFAKAVLAIANHGGGFVVFGLVETAAGVVEAEGRPADLLGFNQDLINGIVQNYCDPAFHCPVHFVASPTEAVYPIVVVPGGHRVPIRAKRAGPNGNTVANNAIYMRKPGPRSETPQTGQDWGELLGRCLQNRRDEMFDQIRALMTGAVPQVEQAPQPAPSTTSSRPDDSDGSISPIRRRRVPVLGSSTADTASPSRLSASEDRSPLPIFPRSCAPANYARPAGPLSGIRQGPASHPTRSTDWWSAGSAPTIRRRPSSAIQAIRTSGGSTRMDVRSLYAGFRRTAWTVNVRGWRKRGPARCST